MAYNRVPPITLPPHVANIFEASVGCGGLTIPTTLTKMNGSKVKAAYNKTLERQMSSSTADWPAACFASRLRLMSLTWILNTMGLFTP
ncbi:unnamed protein product [Brassica napus]|uniref:(rape) hypothetical protein n=1 Tax=Brassica napus TaxID=3708 RepID=A0A816KJ69_BRANA|nr:unnamed protein product [Brassica napus]